MDAFLGIMRSSNWTDFRESLRQYVSPSQNFIYADIKGNIGYQCPGHIPVRRLGHTGNVTLLFFRYL